MVDEIARGVGGVDALPLTGECGHLPGAVGLGHAGLDERSFELGPHIVGQQLAGLGRIDLSEHGRLELGHLLEFVGTRLRDACLPGKADDAHEQRGRNQGSSRHRAGVAAHECPHPIGRARRSGPHRLGRQIPTNIHGQSIGRLVSPRAIFFQGLHRDAVEISPQVAREPRRLGPLMRRDRGERRDPGARPRGIDFADRSADLVETLLAQGPRLEGEHAGEQLVQDHTKRIHIGPCVDVEPGHLGLLGAHVLGGADQRPELGVQRPLGQRLGRGLRHAEVDDLGYRATVLQGHHHVRGFQIAVNDAPLVGVLHALADLDEQIEPLANRQRVAGAVGRDRLPPDILHNEVRAALRRGARVEHMGDSRVIHQREGLSLGLKPRHHLRRVHPCFDDLQRDLTPHGPRLLGQPHLPHAAFAHQFEQAIRSKGVGTVRRALRRSCRVSLGIGVRTSRVFGHHAPPAKPRQAG